MSTFLEPNEEISFTIPIPLVGDDRMASDYLAMVKKAGARRVFLFPPLHNGHETVNPETESEGMAGTGRLPSLEKYKEWSDLLKDRIHDFEEEGIQAGFWLGHTIGHGGSLTSSGPSPYQQLVGPEGLEAAGCFCPLDDAYREYICNVLAIIAQSGVDLILLDDDFRLNLHTAEVPIGCFCHKHLAWFQNRTGLSLSRDQLIQSAFTDEPGEIRKSWLEISEESLMLFAAEIERTVHAVNASARIGLATAMTLWSSEGVDMKKLLNTLAGPTRPFLRAIGAPYWSREPYHAGWITEYTRLQQEWCHDLDVEFVAEGDTFPHSRYFCSSAMVDAFYQGLLASGINNFMHYAAVYSPSPDHETGYLEGIASQLDYYKALCEFFPKTYRDLGVSPLYRPNGLFHAELPDKLDSSIVPWSDEPIAMKVLSRFGIPISYRDSTGPVWLSGCGFMGISDEELRQFLRRGIMADATAARWLLKKGIDIGVQSLEEGSSPGFEQYRNENFCGKYHKQNIWLLTSGDGIYYRANLKETATVVGKFFGDCSGDSHPSVMLYENADGFRFCVYMFDFYRAKSGMQLVYNYARQEQMSRCLAWVNRKPLPVSVNGYPDIRVSCRISPAGERVAISLQNLHLDPLVDPVFKVDASYHPGTSLELLFPGSNERIRVQEGFTFQQFEGYNELKIHCKIQPMQMLGIGLEVDKARC